jgi:stage IV sporulation protein FB
MQGPISWSIPFTRIAGILVRIELFFIIFIVAQVGSAAKTGGSVRALEMFILLMMLFAIVLMHEFGHCFAARSVGGHAEEILLWPLGGLAMVSHPHNAWASFVTTAGGPAVNLAFYLISGGLLLIMGYWPPINPLWNYWEPVSLIGGHEAAMQQLPWHTAWLIRFFFLNWFLFWFNVLCVGFPLDGGRLLQAILWPRYGYYTATKVACYAGFGVAILLSLWAFIFLDKDNYTTLIMTFLLVIFIFVSCQSELQRIEAGIMEDDTFGYDFSQGYTSLERSAKSKERPPSMLQRWMNERAEKKKQREEDERIADELRIDELLAKMHESGGIQALTSEEQRFMKRVSAKLRQKRNSK